MAEPQQRVEIDGVELGEAENTSLSFPFFGIGLTYYFMPVNLYLTGAVGFSYAQVEVDGVDRGSSDVGFGLNVDLGKEWWVSDNWGLGIAGRLWFSEVPDEAGVPGVAVTDVDLSFRALAILFSATYQ